jgi:hypothetical protein
MQLRPLTVNKRNSDTFDSWIILGIIVILSLYLVNVNSKITSFADEWVLNGIFIDFIIIMFLLLLLSYILFSNIISSSLFFNSIALTLIIFTPLLKYANAISLVSPYDPLAHYSFALWIVRYGHVAPLGKLYYTSAVGGLYSTHPGNGLIPAILHISTSIPLDYSMNLVLLLNYIGYATVILLILSKIRDQQNFPRSSFNSSATSPFVLFLIVLVVTSIIYVSPGFGGTFISYLYVGLLFYYIFHNVVEVGTSHSFGKRTSIVASLIIYLGLISTHYSTTFIMTFFFGLLMTVSLLGIKELKKPSIAKVVIVIFVLTFLTYELFADVLMFRTSLIEAIKIIMNLYFRELREAGQAMERHGSIPLIDLIRYLVAIYAKLIYIVFIIFVCLVIGIRRVLKTRHGFTDTITFKALMVIFLLSIISYIPAYGGVASFVGLQRVIPLLQIPLTAITFYFLMTFVPKKMLQRPLKNLLVLLLVLLIIFGYVSSYGLFPLAPIMRYNGEEYRFAGFSPISVYIYDSIRYLATHGSKTIKFITLNPFTTFGYADLLWNISKIPQHGSIYLSPDPDEATKMVENIINNMRNSIIPIYLTDRLSGRIGLKSYYEKPLKILELNTSMIYNNKCYALFLSR